MDSIVRVEAGQTERLNEALVLAQRSFAAMDGVVDPPSSIHNLTVGDMASGSGEVWVIGSPPRATMTVTPRPGVLYLGKLAVAEAERGKGLARRLIETAELRASELGLSWIELQTRIELVDNHRVFKAMGFVETERTSHPGYKRFTSITYRRLVPANRDSDAER